MLTGSRTSADSDELADRTRSDARFTAFARRRSFSLPLSPHNLFFGALLAAGTILLSLTLLPASFHLSGAVLVLILLALSWIDITHGRLPDQLTGSAGLVGLALSLTEGTWPDHLIGVALGFLLTAGVAWAYRAWRGRDGLGFGDVKLTAALGAVVGWQGVPAVLLLASLAGIAFVLVRSVSAGHRLAAGERFPFGPFLCQRTTS